MVVTSQIIHKKDRFFCNGEFCHIFSSEIIPLNYPINHCDNDAKIAGKTWCQPIFAIPAYFAIQTGTPKLDVGMGIAGLKSTSRPSSWYSYRFIFWTVGSASRYSRTLSNSDSSIHCGRSDIALKPEILPRSCNNCFSCDVSALCLERKYSTSGSMLMIDFNHSR